MISRINEKTGLVEQLVTIQNQDVLFMIMEELEAKPGQLVGFDIETHDADRHPGLNEFMNLVPGATEYKKGRKLVFDINRTVITGFSLYVQGDSTVYYVNLAHADVEKRCDPDKIQEFLQRLVACVTLCIHNYSFERTMVLKCKGLDLGHNYVDTMQMAVSAYNDDEYDIETFKACGLLGIAKLIPEIKKTFAGFNPEAALSTEQNDVLQKVIGKQSDAEHSYNGFVRELSYGYGLKKAVKSFFGYEQESFEAALQGHAHMGLVTSEQVLHYGADDAYWCVRLFERLVQYMTETNPDLLKIYFEQENPMPYIWSDCWVRGWRVNHANIYARQETERRAYVEVVRELAGLLPLIEWNEYPMPRLYQKQKWYKGKDGLAYQKYRNKIRMLADNYQEEMEDFDVALLTSGAVTTAWMADEKVKMKKAQLDLRGNFSHYMVQRVLFHDLCQLPFVYDKGEIKTDAGARGKMLELADRLASEPELWLKEWRRYSLYPEVSDEVLLDAAAQVCKQYPANVVKAIIDKINKIAQVEQRIKLFITPYLQLTDPETHRMYPIIRSTLNTRRMAAENPNTMQLSKRGEATYVRGFFLPEREDHLLLSVDWSQVELVLIGEESKDPGFFEAFGQTPYQDLHRKAATSAINVWYPDFTPEMLKSIPGLDETLLEEYQLSFPKVFINPVKQTPLKQKEAYKFWRGDAGKPSNFGYWYSGSLMTVQPKLGWSDDEMWAATDNYRSTFPVAEKWRVDTIDEARHHGFVYIFDGHRRTRYESTMDWMMHFRAKFDAYQDPDISAFGAIVTKRINRRAGNQVVNAKIQGGCATLAKRSILKLWYILKDEAERWDGVFVMPIHDELVFSIRHDQAVAWGHRVLEVMCNHPDLVRWLKLDGTVSIGRTLEPYDAEKAPYGQIELDEAPSLPGWLEPELEGKKLDDERRQRVVDYLMGKEPPLVLEETA